MNEALLRPATPADAEEIWSLWRACAAFDRSLWNDDYPTRDFLLFDLEHGYLHAFLQDGSLTGAVTLMPEDDLENLDLPFAEKEKVAVLTRLCVWPARQGRGVGSRLLSHAERLAATRGARAVHLLCDVRNVPALALYRRAGYRQLGEARLYGDHFYVLEKVLSNAGTL